MSYYLRVHLFLALALLFSSENASAQQLMQPESVAPWNPPVTWSAPILRIAKQELALPRLTLNTDPEPKEELPRKPQYGLLPMVESECFALLGEIRAESAKSTPIVRSPQPVRIAPPEISTENTPFLGYIRKSPKTKTF